MKRLIVICAAVLAVLSFVQTVSAQERIPLMWERVSHFEEKGLPQSALQVVDSIYNLSINENETEHTFKAIIYRMKLNNYYQEDQLPVFIESLEKDSERYSGEMKALTYVLIGRMYLMYYNANSWTISQRTSTGNFAEDDMETWTSQNFRNVINETYKKALSEPELLAGIPIVKYPELISQDKYGKKVQPTLLDFIVHDAINVLLSPMSYYDQARDESIESSSYFQDARLFIHQELDLKDDSQLKTSLEFLQLLLKERLQSDKFTYALVYTDLRRLEIIKSKSSDNNAFQLYFNALFALREKYKDDVAVAEIDYAIASWYLEKGESVSHVPGDTSKAFYLGKADEVCDIIIKNHPSTRPAQLAKQMKNNLYQTSMSLNMEDFVTKGCDFPIYLTYKNLSHLHLSVFSIDPEKYENITRKDYGEKRMKNLLKSADLVKETKIELPGELDLVQHSTEYIMNELPVGFYFILLSEKPLSEEKNYVLVKGFSVTSLAWITDTYTSENYLEVFVMDRESGQPLKDVDVTMYHEEYNYRSGRYVYNRLAQNKTAKDGRFCNKMSENDNSYAFRFKRGDEELLTSSLYYNNYWYWQNDDNDVYENVHFFTDRAVYRPGQTIHVKGICVRSQGKENDLMKNFTTTVYFYDANYQQVAHKQVKTNEYGSFTVDFIIPDGLLNGSLQLKAAGSSTYVRLEEYKRPAFEVKLNDFDGNYQLNKTVEVSGEALSYTGAKITEATVKYRVFAQPQFFNSWRYFYYPLKLELLEFGELKTDEDGKFLLEFLAEPMPSYPVNQDVSFTYTIEVDVTDMTGETQSSSGNLVVGYRDLLMSTNLYDGIDVADLDSVYILTQNLNYQEITAKGSLIFFEMETPDFVVKERQWADPEFKMYTEDEWKKRLPEDEYDQEADMRNFPIGEKALSIKFDTEKVQKYAIPVENLKSGVYKLEIRATDAFGMPVIEEEYLRITDRNEKKLSPDVALDFRSGNATSVYKPGEELEILVGSGCKGAIMFVLVEHEDKILQKNWVKGNQKIQSLKFPVSEDMRGGIHASVFMVYNGRLYQKTLNLTVPFDNKNLDFEFVHFRDEVLPGSEEQIIMKIKNNNNEAVAAEMLACMYDESLDAFYANSFNFSLYSPNYPYHNWVNSAFTCQNAGYLIHNYEREYVTVDGTFPSLNLFGLNYYGSYGYYNYDYAVRGSRSSKTLSLVEADMTVMEEVAVSAEKQDLDMSVVTGNVAGKYGEATGGITRISPNQQSMDKLDGFAQEKPQAGESLKIRSNFNETAFFYPQLRTDKNGEISFAFTAPESLTRWKFLALAHTQDLKSGVIENHITTKKKLMVVPNMPRFLREGDKLTLNVKVTNLTADEMRGNCEIIFIDVMTGEDITEKILLNNEPAQFEVKAGGNCSVSFDLNVLMGLQAVEYTIIAKAGAYGDGEKRVLPVLSNRMLVTESMPMYVNGNSTKVWKFNKLLASNNEGTLRHHKLSLEMTPRPAWYAIQALPYLMEYPYECSEQIFSRFYANSMAAYIANSDPKIQRIFEAWKNIPESNALKSNLQKNEDLKAVMLQQTPWVLEAQDEAERKRRVGVLFDMNRMSNEQRSTFNKLKKRQKGNGAWPWFDGMPENRYITQHIVAGLGHLRHLDVLDRSYKNQTEQMIRHANQYLDNQILKDYRYLKRYYNEEEMNANHLSYTQIHYLYTRSFTMDISSINPAAAEAYKYYYNQAKTYWVEFNPYSKGMIALAMFRAEDKTVANEIMASLKEYAIVDDEMGMYWKNTVGYFWYQAPIETQALLIEAFDEIKNDTESVERMKQWLLNQKRTQDWKTTKATSEAIYALILTGSDLLDLSSDVMVEIGGEIYDPKTDSEVKSEAGTGYFRKDWNGKEIKPEMGEVKLVKTGNGMAWGALHWQYFEDMDKITSHETPLQLEKKLFRKTATDDGMELQQVEDNAEFEVGDELVVRVILRSDRDMEYVHMKDMRASCLEPVSTRSGYQYQGGLGYYMSIRDASVDFFFSWLRKGTYVFEYSLYVTHTGEFSNGITSIQCMYAPEFNSHSEGLRILVK